MENPTIIYLDTETTGNGPDDRLCQLSFLYHDDIGKHVVNELFRAPMDIGYEAMAVHHITNKMVADRPLFLEAPEYPGIKELLEAPTSIVVAHNAGFDLGMLAKENIVPAQSIDTLKVMRTMDPNMENGRHGLQYLRYFLDLDSELTEPVMAHDAFGDVLVLELLFGRLLTDVQTKFDTDYLGAITKMVEISNEPMYIPKVPFGKYKGQTLVEIAKTDPGYLQWLLNEKKKSLAEGKAEEADWIYSIEKALSL